ncbi:putative histone deacetylase, partial [Tribonema minus]
MWHNPGVALPDSFTQPARHWEHAETKRRLHNLLEVSGMLTALKRVRARAATDAELAYVHTPEYIARVKALSAGGGGDIGEETHIDRGGFDIVALAAGGALAAVDAVLSGATLNAYALLRPPGHHAVADNAMGFCVFNNVAVGAHHALRGGGGGGGGGAAVRRVAIVDFDVHHGNGTQAAFEADPRVLFVSLHQDGNYPKTTGKVGEVGVGDGRGTTLNVPLPPGSGEGAYAAAFERVVVPAVDAFEPDLLLVSAGYDASFMDPLAHMMLSSEAFRAMAARLVALAERHCGGRAVFLHEGGYSDVYVPFCGLAVVEELAGCRTQVRDPLLAEAQAFAQQALQPHQDAAIAAAEANLTLL